MFCLSFFFLFFFFFFVESAYPDLAVLNANFVQEPRTECRYFQCWCGACDIYTKNGSQLHFGRHQYLGYTLCHYCHTGVLVGLCISTQRPPGFPPGPIPLPFLGNINLFMNKHGAHVTLSQLAKRYGGVVSVKIGPIWKVVLCNIEMTKEALLKRSVDFAGRPDIYSVKLFTQGYKNIVFSPYSEAWKLHRKLAHSAIRHFASGKALEDMIFTMVPKMAQVIDSHDGSPFDPKLTVRIAIYNILATMCFGHDYGFDDPKLQLWMDLYDEQAKEFSKGIAADVIPVLQGVKTPGYKKVIKFMEKFFRPFQEELGEHKVNFDTDNVKDLIDCLLKEQHQTASEETERAHVLTDTHIVQTLSDVFSAGSDTTVTTLRWAIAYMAEYPEVQTRVSQEIQQVIGNRHPSLNDRDMMPYTEATIMEIFRCGSLVPLGVIHATTRDTLVSGYSIPHGTWVFVNHWGLHHDENEWQDAFQFKPEHFLDDAGRIVQHPNSFLPFSAEIFLLFSWLIQHYTLSKAPGLEEDTVIQADLTDFAFRRPKAFQIIAVKKC
ncbi:steroid 17-alpha-hydroxylase/17,20 lyase-like [Amphiura filiformis]|uniref:steroid 17-alpha-hydroxylase/17,20 lyase-like n=1 Tax=Amphiura filiformis TaxID=82378 RepID=UPI003B2122F3